MGYDRSCDCNIIYVQYTTNNILPASMFLRNQSGQPHIGWAESVKTSVKRPNQAPKILKPYSDLLKRHTNIIPCSPWAAFGGCSV